METQSATLGAVLRARRLELGLTLEGLAEKTRIRRIYLIALEEDRPEELPGETYQIGFLRTYAGALGLKMDDLPGRKQTRVPAEINLTRFAAPDGSRFSTKGFLAIAAAVLLVVAAIVFASVFRAAEESPEARIESPVADVGSVKEEILPIQGGAVEALPAQEEAAVQESAPGHFSGTAEPPQVASAADSEEGLLNVIRLRALGPNRLELVLDNRPPQRYELKADSELSWRLRRSALLRVDNPSAVQIWLGDELIDLGGKPQILLQAEGAESERR